MHRAISCPAPADLMATGHADPTRCPARGMRVADGASPRRWLPGRPRGRSALVVHLGLSYPHPSGRQQDLRRATVISIAAERCSTCLCLNRCRKAASRSRCRAAASWRAARKSLDEIRAQTWMNLADIGSTVSALAFAFSYVSGERQKRYQAAVRRYLGEWALQFQQPSGGFTNGRLAGQHAKWIYSIATGTTALWLRLLRRSHGRTQLYRGGREGCRVPGARLE